MSKWIFNCHWCDEKFEDPIDIALHIADNHETNGRKR